MKREEAEGPIRRLTLALAVIGGLCALMVVLFVALALWDRNEDAQGGGAHASDPADRRRETGHGGGRDPRLPNGGEQRPRCLEADPQAN